MRPLFRQMQERLWGRRCCSSAWRVLNGDALPFDEPAARRFVEASYDRAANFAAAVNHDPGQDAR
jgi:hypothetical protein